MIEDQAPQDDAADEQPDGWLTDPRVWAQLRPVLDQVIDQRVEGKLKESEERIVGQVKALLEQVTPNVPELVSQAVDAKLDPLVKQFTGVGAAAGNGVAPSLNNGGASAAPTPVAQPSRIDQLGPLLQMLLSQNKPAQPQD